MTETATVRYLVGDVRARINDLPDRSIALICTSPPFLLLRSYLPDDHPLKHAEIGSEPTPALFIDCLLRQVAQWAPKLTEWGSIVVELGDTFAGSGGSGGDWSGDPAHTTRPRTTEFSTAGPPRRTKRRTDGGQFGQWPQGGTKHNQDTRPDKRGGLDWPEAKSAGCIPESFAWALAYGTNPYTGEPSPAGRWLVRNKIIWARPNPVVGELGDKFRVATSMIVVATRNPKRWFDLDAVRSDKAPNRTPRAGAKEIANPNRGTNSQGTGDNPNGAPPKDWLLEGPDGWALWELPTKPYEGAHFAVFPPELPRRFVLSMCPAEVCGVCGHPRRRIVKVDGLRGVDFKGPNNNRATGLNGSLPLPNEITRTTIGWTDCGHDDYEPARVLDPFAGSGTTLAVAANLGRDAIGIDIDERNAALAHQRLGEMTRIHHEHHDTRDHIWSVEPAPLPNQGAQIPGQLTMATEWASTHPGQDHAGERHSTPSPATTIPTTPPGEPPAMADIPRTTDPHDPMDPTTPDPDETTTDDATDPEPLPEDVNAVVDAAVGAIRPTTDPEPMETRPELLTDDEDLDDDAHDPITGRPRRRRIA